PKGTRLPWHRVINSAGRISNPDPARQQQRLEEEGVVVSNLKVHLRTYQWRP
ncbi:MAG: MGMT family protein, partial [Pseudomonadales bacterium]|nr:MGMT family protein [Pseudomonadales bacterium]